MSRYRASAVEWKWMRATKLDECRVCETAIGLSLHHVVPRSLGGDDEPANLVPLCGSGTTGCHGAVEARDEVSRRTLAATLTDDERTYAEQRKYGGWVEDYYGG